ncbi:MAG: flagellar export protein FliJ, partial [Pseudomonadota bacterium]
MARDPAKLRTLVRVLELREQRLRKRLSERRAATDGAGAQVDELSRLQAEYHQRLSRAGADGVRAADLRLWQRFNSSLDDAVEVQAERVAALERELAAERHDWIAARA